MVRNIEPVSRPHLQSWLGLLEQGEQVDVVLVVLAEHFAIVRHFASVGVGLPEKIALCFNWKHSRGRDWQEIHTCTLAVRIETWLSERNWVFSIEREGEVYVWKSTNCTHIPFERNSAFSSLLWKLGVSSSLHAAALRSCSTSSLFPRCTPVPNADVAAHSTAVIRTELAAEMSSARDMEEWSGIACKRQSLCLHVYCIVYSLFRSPRTT